MRCNDAMRALAADLFSGANSVYAAPLVAFRSATRTGLNAGASDASRENSGPGFNGSA